MGCQFSAICKVVAQPVGNHLFPVNAVRRLRRRYRRNSATPAQRRSRSVPLCDKNGPFVTSGLQSKFRADCRKARVLWRGITVSDENQTTLVSSISTDTKNKSLVWKACDPPPPHISGITD